MSINKANAAKRETLSPTTVNPGRESNAASAEQLPSRNTSQQPPTHEFVYGIFISIGKNEEAYIAERMKANAKKKAEVAVKHDGVIKEFTLKEFFGRLGFSNEP